MKKRKTDPVSWLMLITGAILFLPFLGKVHLFDWDEINFAECAREMLTAKQYFLVTINYLPFWEKPPLFIWMQALSMKIFGVCDYAARFPNALCGMAALPLLYHAGKIFKDRTFGILWALAYMGSLLPFFYFKSGIIDPWFNFFIFTGIYFFIRYTLGQKGIPKVSPYKWVTLSALCIGLAVLTKGPVGFLIFFISALVYMVMDKGARFFNIKHGAVFILIFTGTGGSWFLLEFLTGHRNLIVEFIQYQIRLLKTGDSGHGGPFYYHLVVLLFGCFPASVLAIRGIFSMTQNDEKLKTVSSWMRVLFWVVLIMFSLVKTKIIHYSSLCYYPLSYFAALVLYRFISGHLSWNRWMGWGLGIIGFIIGIAIFALPVAGMNLNYILSSGIIKDPFVAANLQAEVHWSYWYCLVGLFFISSVTTALLLFRKSNYKAATLTLFGSTIVTTFSFMVLITPKIEQYTQEAAVEFYENLQNKDVYVATLGYKSYVQYFYSREQPLHNPKGDDEGWLLDGNIDKPAYFSSKITSADEYLKEYPSLNKLYSKNGFVFFVRSPPVH